MSAFEKIVYPHRINLIEKKVCDACQEKTASRLLGIPAHPYIGLQSCDQPSCAETCQEWIDTCTMSVDDLRTEFGEWVYVIRSNGKQESGWWIKGSAYQDKDGGPHWVRLCDKRKRLSKCVTLDVLRSWNLQSSHNISST